jgi:hypothetical protein
MTAIRLLPGLFAAITAYLALPLLTWLGFFPARFLLFLLICTAVTLALDIAMKRYGR